MSANDFISKDYAGFLGFETAIADMPTKKPLFLRRHNLRNVFLSDGIITGSDTGHTFLTVSFDTLDVTGELHSSEVALCLITNGRISDNGITGGVST